MVPLRLPVLAGVLASAAGCAVLFGSGCAGLTPLDGRFDILTEKPDEDLLSEEVALIADTHSHHLFGDPVFTRTNLAQSFSWTAIRAPQQDLYGRDLQAYALARFTRGQAIIHLGDADNASCEDELAGFLQMMADRGPGARPWFMLPGNHDGFFYGDAHLDTASGDWPNACGNGSRPLTKPAFLRGYLAALGAEANDPGAVALGQKLKAGIEPDGGLDYRGADPAMLQAVRWHLDADPWASFLVQRLDLTRRTPIAGPDGGAPPGAGAATGHPKVIAILLDTASYTGKPEIIPIPRCQVNAGLTGEVGEAQVAIAEGWARQAHDEGAFLILMGHHEYGSLDGHAQAVLERFHTRYGAALYVSAHDHIGKWRAVGTGKDTWPELNVGSLLDSPIELRHLVISRTRILGSSLSAGNPSAGGLPDGGSSGAAAQPRLAVVSELTRLDDRIASASALGESDLHCDQHVGWEARPGEKDFYLSYQTLALYAPGQTQRTILDVMLRSYQRYLQVLPIEANEPWPSDLRTVAPIDAALTSPDTSVKIELLRRLIDAARAVPTDTFPARRDYRVCQAWWGSRYAKLAVRLPEPTDWTILLPATKP